MNRWKRKNFFKVVRTIAEFIIVVIMLFIIIRALFWEPDYVPYDEKSITKGEDGGFIALSYFGVEKYESDSTTLIDEKRLEEHLKALYESGYVTISQQDVLDYYEGKKTLPEKSLFLMFEDGRRDTAIFAEKIMEKYNFCATMGTYARNIILTDSKFLSGDDVIALEEHSFWELGVNGYRLEYINVFDQFENYFGYLNSNEFAMVSKYLVRDYDHYLMDFIRDADRVPLESKEEMKDRIRFDYDQMKEIYEKQLGKLPPFYVLMHSNTGAFGTNEQVSMENATHIYDKFKANFNWEGTALNQKNGEIDNSIYQLTRLQPQENWYTNHLLMRIADETGNEMAFVTGDEERSKAWTVLNGAAEFKKNHIVLTSPVSGEAKMLLKGCTFGDGTVETILNGNVAGTQSIYLRADETGNTGIGIRLINNVLSVTQVSGGSENTLYSLDLFEFDGGSEYSDPEVELQGLIEKEKAIIQFAEHEWQVEEAKLRLAELESKKVASMDEGAEGYVPMIDLNDKGQRNLRITLDGNYLTLTIDETDVVKNLKIDAPEKGNILLAGNPLSSDERFSQRNLTDVVYDSVFTDFHVVKGETVIYSNRLTSFEKVKEAIRNGFEQVIIWFINHL
ncbi:MAG: glycoside hydrolase [Lachnospiraceae bacterium]|nr:glycoside hydrolase [Lachnospiraceae bacterium]